MPFRQGIFLEAGQRTQHAHIGVFFDNLAQQAFVPGSAHLIQHHARKLQTGLKGGHAPHQRCGGARHLGAVDAENDGACQRTRKLSGGARPRHIHAVKEAPVALDQPKHLAAAGLGLRLVHGVFKKGLKLMGRQHVRIKIGGGPACGHGQPGSVDVVRPFFESLDRMPLRGQRMGKPQRKQGFTAAARKGRYAQPGHAQALG